MNRAITRLFFGLLCALALVAARAEPVAARDAASAHAVVQGQLDAFAADNAAGAFAFAAPSIREVFGTPERFIAMVRAGYPAVYRPASIAFLQPVWVSGVLVQGVQLTDQHGALWLAVYRLERQADKSWRISGCDVTPSLGRMT